MTRDDEIFEVWNTDKECGFRMLMNTYQEAIYAYIRRMVVMHDDAEDVMQETFIQVFRNLNQFRRESSLSTWIYKIATNECIRFLNWKKGHDLPSEDINGELLNSLRASDYIDYDNKMAVKFQEAILQLPDKQRIVFNLRYYDELEYTDISKITGTKVDTLKVDYHYAKEKIKNFMTTV
jgi:RNA polymerase sigma-70 factor (ECF subfamily)